MKRSFSVLVVEKSDVVRRLTKRLLKNEGLQVLEAPDAPGALALLFKPENHVDLVIIGEIGSRERGPSAFGRPLGGTSAAYGCERSTGMIGATLSGGTPIAARGCKPRPDRRGGVRQLGARKELR